MVAVFEVGFEELYWVVFMVACLFVPFAFFCLSWVRDDAETFLLVVDLAFDALAFPVCKLLINVFSCTVRQPCITDIHQHI